MDKLNVRIEAARLAVESGANKETFTEMARVIEKYIIGNMKIRMQRWRKQWIF